MLQALSFNDVTLTPIIHHQTPWIRSAELAQALGYSDERSVSKIYQRNAEEFSDDMTQVIEISEGVNLTTKIRIFSLRGCHLLAMFARTPVAKAFRVWVLDVLEKLNLEKGQSSLPALSTAPITPEQQCTLQNMVRVLVDNGGIYANIWSRFNNHFRLGSYKQLPQNRMGEAVAYLMNLDVQVKQPALPAPAKPNRRDELIDIYMKAFQLRHNLLELETDIHKLYDDHFCTVKRNVPRALYPFVQEDDNTMYSLIQACTGSIKALQHTLETRMVQLV